MMNLSQHKVKCIAEGCPYQQLPKEVRRHIRNVHKDEALVDRFNLMLAATKAEVRGTGVLTCEKCPKHFTSVGSLSNHIRKVHIATVNPADINPADISLASVVEEPAQKKLCRENIDKLELDLSKIKKIHEINNQKLQCPHSDCEINKHYSSSRRALCTHFEEAHGAENMLEKKEFDNEEDYKVWRARREEESGSSFKTRNSAENGSRIVQLFECQHQGHYKSAGDTRHRPFSKKMTGDHLCTAFLRVNKIGEKISINACFSHIRHEISIPNLKLTSSQEEQLAEMIIDGRRNGDIIRKMALASGCDTRLNHLTPDDIRNFKNRFELNIGQYHNDDLTSVKKRVDLKKEEDGIRRFVMPDDRGNNFLLVIITPQHLELIKTYSHKIVLMDDTHNLTRYGLKLTTLIVVDNYDRGIPAGFLLSSSTTSSEVSQFFEELRNLYPTFNPKFVMTDEAASFFNGFRKVFPNSLAQKVMCRWHVFRAWKMKAKEYLKDNDMAGQILSSLRELMREPRREKVMHRILSILQTLDNSGTQGSKKFAEYFHKYYYGNVDEWAACARGNISCQTTMFAEAWHSVLKKNVIGEKKGVRADRLLAYLYEACSLIENKHYTATQRHLYKACPRKAQNRIKCDSAAKEEKNYLIRKSDDLYEVQNLVNNKIYEVEDYLNCFCDTEENTHCSSCGACYYRFTCSCLHSLSGIACKHKHLVLKHIDKNRNIEVAIGEEDFIDDRISPIPFDERVEPVIEEDSGFGYIQMRRQREQRDDISEQRKKKMDKVNNTWNIIQENLRRKLKKEDDAEIDAVLDKLQTLLNDFLPEERPSEVLSTRSNANEINRTARDSMFSNLKKRAGRKRTQSNRNTTIIPQIEIYRCSICGNNDPELPDDIDEEEEEARLTDWKRCALCKIPVHYTCAMTAKTCSCSPSSQFENYPADYQNEIDESSD